MSTKKIIVIGVAGAAIIFLFAYYMRYTEDQQAAAQAAQALAESTLPTASDDFAAQIKAANERNQLIRDANGKLLTAKRQALWTGGLSNLF